MTSDPLAGLDFDPYEILGLTKDASSKDLKLAYRRKALEFHPDKNPERKSWAERKFQQLSTAFQLLSDDAGRRAYDALLKAKEAAKARARKVDAKRRKFREELEAREAGARSQAEEESAAMRRLEAEIARLRKEGSAMLAREQEEVAREVEREAREAAQERKRADAQRQPPRLKAKWTSKETYDADDLRKLFESYGEVKELIVASSGKSCLVEFASTDSALLAFRRETGISGDPLTLSWLSGKPSEVEEREERGRSAEGARSSSGQERRGQERAGQPQPRPAPPPDFEATVPLLWLLSPVNIVSNKKIIEVLQRLADAQKRKELLKAEQRAECQ